MTYGRYTDQVDTGIVMIDHKTGIVEANEPDVKMMGKLLKVYGFKRVTIMKADGTVEDVVQNDAGQRDSHDTFHQ